MNLKSMLEKRVLIEIVIVSGNFRANKKENFNYFSL